MADQMNTPQTKPAADPQPAQKADRHESAEFERQAEESAPGLVMEFVDFLVHNKKWWLTPIILVLLLLALFVFLSGTAAAPFIYTIW